MNQVLTRDFLQHFKDYKHSPEPVFIKDRKQTVGVYVTIEQWEQKQIRPKVFTFEDLKKYQGRSGIKNISQNIDEIY